MLVVDRTSRSAKPEVRATATIQAGEGGRAPKSVNSVGESNPDHATHDFCHALLVSRWRNSGTCIVDIPLPRSFTLSDISRILSPRFHMLIAQKPTFAL